MFTFHAANLDRPFYQWSERDWRIFRAVCRSTPRQFKFSRKIVTAIRSGKRIADVAEHDEISKEYVSEILAAEALRDAERMYRFHANRKDLGRPIDMGGPRDIWIEWDVIDECE